MILTCPNCSLTYAITEAQLGPQGRTVRCASCKTTWHAEKVEDPIELPLTKAIEKPAKQLKEVKAKKIPLLYREMIEGQKRHKALMAQGLIWGALGVTFLALLGSAYLMRVDVVRAFPRLAGAYASVGLPVNAAGLEFVDLNIEKTLKGGRFAVTVTAAIKNVRDQDTPVPPVKVRILDKNNATLSEILIPSNGLIVEPNATRTLAFDVPDPKNVAANLDLAFDLQAMKTQARHRSAPIAPVAHATEAPVEAAHDTGHDEAHDAVAAEPLPHEEPMAADHAAVDTPHVDMRPAHSTSAPEAAAH